MRLGQRAHRVRDPGGRQAAAGADRVKDVPVGLGQPSPVRGQRQHNDSGEGRHRSRQLPAGCHRILLASAREQNLNMVLPKGPSPL